MANRKHDSKPLRVLFRAEGGGQLGLGHLSRCRSLATAFSMAYSTEMYCALSDQLLGLEFFHGLPVTVKSPDDFDHPEFYDVAILDIPEASLGQQQRLRNIANLLVQIDDEGEGPFTCHILIRPNLLGLFPPKTFDEERRYWTGREYVIVHPDFAKIHGRIGTNEDSRKKILVCFGGSDPAQLTEKVIPILKDFSGAARVEVVLGNAFKAKDKVITRLAGEHFFSVTVNCADMARRIACSDLAIISGGTIMYEVACLGIPALVLCQNAAQQAEAEIFARAGAAINLGIHDQFQGQLVHESLLHLLGNQDLLTSMSLRGRQLVSCHGADLIVDKIVAIARSTNRR